MPDLDRDIAAYEARRAELEAQNTGKWVVFHASEMVSLYDSFELAAEDAVRRFGRGPYLIRQIGAPPITLPASVMYSPTHATNKMRF
jgi:hypothetical protein